MPSKSAQIVAFLLSSGAAVAVGYYHIPISTIQQVIGVLIAVVVVSLNKSLIRSTGRGATIFRWVLLLLTSTLIQLTILSTGGFYSPFLILFHIYALGLSLLFGYSSTLFFLFFALAGLTLELFITPELEAIFRADPGPAILYFISFFVVVPIAMLLSQHYHLKDALTKILTRQLKVEQAILSDVNELVFITDLRTAILSVNEVVERVLERPEPEIVHKLLFDIVILKDQQGRNVDAEYLRLKQLISNNAPKRVFAVLLFTKNSSKPKVVDLQVKPVTNLEGEIDQLTFIISASSTAFENEREGHPHLTKAFTTHRALIEDLRTKLAALNRPDLVATTQMIKMIQQDTQTLVEIEDHPLTERQISTDIAQLVRTIVVNLKQFSELCKTPLDFALPDFTQHDVEFLAPHGFVTSPLQLTSAYFTTTIDVKWLSVIVEKLTTIAILISSRTQYPKVIVAIKRSDAEKLTIEISCYSPLLTEEEQKQLFQLYYGDLLSKTNLHVASGLEGAIAQTVAAHLNIQLSTRYDPQTSLLTILFSIPKAQPVTEA